MLSTFRPTKRLLVETVAALFETKRPSEILADLTQKARGKGFSKAELAAQTPPNFIESYTLGKLVNDYDPTKVSEDDWNQFIMNIIDNTFFSQE